MRTKPAGVLLIIIGAGMMAYTGFNYITTKKVVDIGAIQINQEVNHPVQWSPVIGGIILAGGILLMIAGRKTTS
jgi:hypothetical protein